MRIGRSALGVGLATLMAAVVGWIALRGARGHHPNVVVVLWDTVRADRTSLYGNPVPTTPNLVAWAAESAVYRRAYSAGMWTVPSHGSLFTGLPTSSHGAKVGWLWLDDHWQTLAETLSGDGYATFAWSSNPFLSEQTNLLQGFDTIAYSWRDPDAAACSALTHGKLLPDDRSVEIGPGFAPTAGHGEGWPEHLTAYKDCGPHIAERFLAWVDQGRQRDPDRPFFGYLNYLEAHHPRVPSLEARRAVSDPDRIARALDTDASLFRVMSAMEGRGGFTDDELASIRATYDATLWDLDHATASVVDGLRQRGLLDDTILVILSDHGENLGERGMFDHRWDLHQTLVHVPLVIRYPPAVKRGSVDDPVSTEGLYGTLLDLAGLPTPHLGYELPRLDSDQTVVSELEAPTPRLAEIKSAFPDLDPNRWKLRYQAIFEGPWKLLRASDFRQQLFDLDQDPDEAVDRGPEKPAEAERLRQELVFWEKHRPKYDATLRIGTDRPGNPLKADDHVQDQLRQLGYTSPESSPPAPVSPENP